MKREIAAMLDWLYLILGLVLLVLTILSDYGILFPAERNYLIFYIVEGFFLVSRAVRILRRKRKVVEEIEEE